jgi:hypothetical protein
MAQLTSVGQAGLQGWRAKVGDAVAPPVARKAPVSEDQVRAAVGALFFVLATLYVVKTAKAVAGELRGG